MAHLDEIDPGSLEAFLNLDTFSQPEGMVCTDLLAVDNLQGGPNPTDFLLHSPGAEEKIKDPTKDLFIGDFNSDNAMDSIDWLTHALASQDTIGVDDAIKQLCEDPEPEEQPRTFSFDGLIPTEDNNMIPISPSFALDPASPSPSTGSISEVECMSPSEMSYVSSTVGGVTTRTYKVDVDDDELVALPTRELNRRLQGLPRDVVRKIKGKRRTLKNRGYAQNCRSKRLHVKENLETVNANLMQELEVLKTQVGGYEQQLSRAAKALKQTVRERDMWMVQCENLRTRGQCTVTEDPAFTGQQ